MDQSVSKLLGLHLPNSHAVSQLELEISPLVQTAALMGLGLVYQGSCQRCHLINFKIKRVFPFKLFLPSPFSLFSFSFLSLVVQVGD